MNRRICIMKTLEISDETFTRLQLRAKPLIDTADTLIARLLDDSEPTRRQSSGEYDFAEDLSRVLEESVGNTRARVTNNANSKIDELTEKFSVDWWVDGKTDLTHTRVKYCEIAGEAIHRPNWNKISRMMHEVGLRQ